MDVKRFQKWAEHQYSVKQRIFALIPSGILVIAIVPFVLAVVSSRLDHWIQLPRFDYGLTNLVVGLFFIVPGIIIALWSIYAQMTLGKGTPVPAMATQNLVVQKPFSYCRNPMSFGTILFYVGVSVWIGSLSAFALTLLFSVLLIIYLKIIEERELKMRFGSEYTGYKQNTPFLIPRLKESSHTDR